MKTHSEPGTLPSPKGVYANYFEVGHTAFEFVLDFGQRYGGGPGSCHMRIVTSPVYARALFETLRESLDQYTAAFGSLPEPVNEDAKDPGDDR